jgi:signal transduction histidine kinase
MAAAAAVVVLTLLAGGLAARDVVRERRMAALRATFLAGVTHEIKTPLTSIRLMAETLRQGRATAATSPELLGTIVNEAEHLSDLVDNLLSTSRIESGARTYRPRVVDFGELVRAARKRVDYALAKDGFTLVEHVPDVSIRVHADPDALVQAVLNLLGNAMKYSGASRQIRLVVDVDDTHARLRVADDGVGVPPAEQARIFKSFYRAASAEALTTGAGLGLALVRHFADAHGGGVSVESAPGRGSVFTIVLPRAAAADPRLVSTDAPSPTHG